MFTARTISKLMDKWAIEKTPTEIQITDALETIGRLHEYCLQLERKIHNQRAANRENWEIVEMRKKYQMGNQAANKRHCDLIKRHAELIMRHSELKKEVTKCQEMKTIVDGT